MPIYVLVRFNLLLLTCYWHAMVDNHDTLRGYGIPCEQNFSQKNANLGLILDTRRDTIWTVKDDTDGTPQGTPPMISENAICRTCMDSVVEELRTPHIANATGNGFTTEW